MQRSKSPDLSQLLVLPEPQNTTRQIRKPALNSKTVCITEIEVLDELKAQEVEKAEAEAVKKVKQLERQQKRCLMEMMPPVMSAERYLQMMRMDMLTLVVQLCPVKKLCLNSTFVGASFSNCRSQTFSDQLASYACFEEFMLCCA